MRFRVLGPMQVWGGEGWEDVRAAQQRSVLAVLLVEAGRVVSTDRLVDVLWGDEPPKRAVNTVQVYVNRLRGQLGEDGRDVLVTGARGYRLPTADGDLDARVFLDLAESGRRELAEGRPESASGTLAAALALWRGPAFADVPGEAVEVEAARLEQARLTALEARLEADLRLGRHVEVVDEAQEWAARHPLRERLLEHLMLALYRCGRRAEALDAYRRGRAHLVEELGLEPGPGLRDLERAVLADDPALTLPDDAVPVPPVRPAQLPADVVGFTGRAAELRALDGLVSASPAVVVVTGTAGVGKTAVALRWAHRARDRFPDGQLFADLRGYAPGPPTTPLTVLTRFLHALGVHADDVPADVDEAAALYRSLLADRRVLVVLDNARDPAQALPLLPGAGGSAVLVTSRTPLSGLVAGVGARALALDVLAEAEAEDLLRRLLGPARTGPVADLARLCARLPLALRIAAAYLHARPALPVERYVEQLRGEDRLAALRAPDEKRSAVRAAFDLSYQRLGGGARRVFRLLGAAPAVDFTVGSAAALAGVPEPEADRLLAELTAAHLLDEHRPGRFRSHDLLRLYARRRAAREDDTAVATDRLHAWYLATTDDAAAVLYPQMRRQTRGAVAASSFAGPAGAAAWLDAERPNLLAAVTHSARHRPVAAAGLLADALRGYFWLRMNTVDWLAVAEAGLTIARATGDGRATIAALLSLADVHYRQGQTDDAERHSADALALAARIGYWEGQADARGNLGNLALEAGRLADAAKHHRAALALNRWVERVPKQANNLGNLGIVHWHRGELRVALGRFEEALALNRRLRSAHGRAVTLTNLGGVAHDLGDLDRAAEHLRAALDLQREVGDRGAEAEARAELAAVRADAGHYDEAFEQAHTARSLARATRDRHRETEALIALGAAHHLLGHHADAVACYGQARDLAREITYRFGETKALIGVAAARRDPDAACAAVDLAARHGYLLLEGQALLAWAATAPDRDRSAADAARARVRFADTGHRLGEARARLVLARLHSRAGRHHQSRADRQGALSLFRGIGAPWSDHANAL
ncbi:BTAD domain-containing putative transcriptional regulator [Saccharothrix sp. NPDC042600]|uniref:AfsR/SARP family transcriptional regulator n=1 Tax=Saccharothrix TaxID=2071 RepID=UPI0033C7639E|nr:BTAD domain-containing putative transcriptional regulator [Saccharothrix mutabilis subsp. capreolus]